MDKQHKKNPAKFDGVEDMSDMSILNEPCVLYNLSKRYDHDLIYTYSGLFLVAINPYKQLQIYSPQMVDWYTAKRRNEVAPHIFAVSDTAYRAMLSDGRNQSLLITCVLCLYLLSIFCLSSVASLEPGEGS